MRLPEAGARPLHGPVRAANGGADYPRLMIRAILRDAPAIKRPKPASRSVPGSGACWTLELGMYVSNS